MLQVEEHDKALRLLVHDLGDYGAAHNYCVLNSAGRPKQYRTMLFHTLLAIYLQPDNQYVNNDLLARLLIDSKTNQNLLKP